MDGGAANFSRKPFERVIRTLAVFAREGRQLWQAHAKLERCVRERTAALSEANLALLKETKARRRVEEERRRLLDRVVTTQEEERRRIARELHDDFAQRLSLLEMELVGLQQNPPSERSQVSSRLEPLIVQLAGLSDDLRQLSHRLHPSILEDLGLEAALRALIKNFERSVDISLRLIGEDLPHPVPLPIASAIYGITQEAVRNAATHARGAKVFVNLCGPELRLTVHDNGPGFDPQVMRTGLGLVSMRERAQLVGGRFEFYSRPGHGTEVRVSMPWPEEPRSQ